MASKMNTEAVFVTIDSKSTKDIDDAIVVVKTTSGFKVEVAIADPTNKVEPGSDADIYARNQAATIYAREMTKTSMLPKAISEGSSSLMAGKSRNSFVFSIELDDNLQITSFEPSMRDIVVAHRLSYEDIPAIAGDVSHHLHQQIKDAVGLGQALLDGRRSKGALAVYDLKQFLMTDEEGNLLQMKSRSDTIGHILVQEMMILTNSLLGQYLVKNNIPAIYRNHEPALAAPSQLELRQTIETMLFSSTENQEVAADKLHTLLGKAKYEAVAKGHYGLNLPVYIHGTSPLRRYADLVNLRQLKAHLHQAPFTHSMVELQIIAEHITTVLQERKDASVVHFKSVVSRNAARIVKSGDLWKMDSTHLAMAIKNVRDTVGVNGPLAREIHRRMKVGTLEDTVIDRLYLEVDRAAIEDELASDMSAWLFENPMKAMHLMVHGTAIKLFSGVEFSTEALANGFTSNANLTMATGAVVMGAGVGAKKKLAEQYALCAAILNALGLPEHEKPQSEVFVSAKPSTAPVVPGVNHKGALLEFCTKLKAKAPVFTFETKGASHKPMFKASASFDSKGEPMRATSEWADTKKAAENQAAGILLALAKSKIISAVKAARPVASGNPVGDLQEYAMKQGIPLPEYSFKQLSQTPPLFECNILLAHGVGIREMAQAPSKSESKKIAATKVLLRI